MCYTFCVEKIKKKERIINFRALFFCFVSFFCSIIFAKNIFSLDWFYLIFFALVAITILVLAIKFGCVKRALYVLVSFFVGLIVFCISLYAFQGNIYKEKQTVKGQIKSLSSSLIVLENVTIGDKSEKNVIVYTYGKNFEIGQIVVFNDYVSNVNLFELDTFNSSAYKNYAPYSCEVSSDDITISGTGRLTIAQKLQARVKKIYVDNLPSEDVGLFYGMIFGDKTDLDYEIRQSFQTSGISHMLAVSGLHVGFLIGLLNFLFNKLKTKRIVKCCVLAVILFFYSWMCSFAPSVVRASLMSMIVLLSGLFGKQYDFVNSISLAGLIILLFSPLSAFDIGFQLSFLCVFSIAFVYPMLSKLFTKIKLPKFFSDTFALTLGVQLGLLPLTANYFGQMSLLSIFTNLICVPLFEVAFVGIFVVTILACIIAPLGIFLIPFKYIINFITLVATFVSNQTFFIIKMGSTSFALILCFYSAVFIIGNFVNLKKSLKLLICFVLIAICFGFNTLMAIPQKYTQLTILQYQNNCHVIVSSKNQKLLITNTTTVPYDFTKKSKIDTFDCVACTSEDLDTSSIEDYYNISTKSVFGNQCSVGDFDIQYIKLLENINYIQIKVDGYTIWYLLGEFTDSETEILQYTPQPNVVINKDYTSEDIADFKLTSNSFSSPKSLFANDNYGFEIFDGNLKKYWSLN